MCICIYASSDLDINTLPICFNTFYYTLSSSSLSLSVRDIFSCLTKRVPQVKNVTASSISIENLQKYNSNELLKLLRLDFFLSCLVLLKFAKIICALILYYNAVLYNMCVRSNFSVFINTYSNTTGFCKFTFILLTSRVRAIGS